MGDLGQVLDRVLAGSFSLAVAKAEAAHQALRSAESEQLEASEDAAMAPAQTALHRKDYEQGLRLLDKIDVSHDKVLAHRVLMKRFYVLAYLGDSRLREVGRKITQEPGVDDFFLAVIARDLVDPTSRFPSNCYPTALDLAVRAVVLAPKRPSVLDCYAVVLAKNGRSKEAADAEAKAVEYAKADSKTDPVAIKAYRERLDKFKKGA
jgi:hypothetical protein